LNRKDKIIHESLKLFSLKGFISTSIQDIMTAAGVSKGGFYNHFKSKEELFHAVLRESQKNWRARCLFNLDQLARPIDQVRTLLMNYKDRYLKDTEHFPGGCIFITLSVELDDQLPHLSTEINKGFIGLKRMINRLLLEAKEAGEVNAGVNTVNVTEMIFSGMLGASVIYGTDKSSENLDRTINCLIEYLNSLSR